jgi:serine/threonine protein kinase
MGAVFLAEDQNLGRKVAVKLLNRAPTESLLERFQREAMTMASLRHENIVQVYETGVVDGCAFLILEFLEGQSLDRGIPGLNPLLLVRPLTEALCCVHAAGLLHRDVKPANIFQTHSGRIVLTDFGLVLDPELAQLTATGAILGSLGYLSPEILRGGRGDPGQDWWALGVTLFSLGEGHLPFQLADLVGAASGRSLPPLNFFLLRDASPLRVLIEALLCPQREDRIDNGKDLLLYLDAGEELQVQRSGLGSGSFHILQGTVIGQEKIASLPSSPRAARPLIPLLAGISLFFCLLILLMPRGGRTVPRTAQATREFSSSLPWKIEDLSRCKQEYQALETLEVSPEGVIAQMRSQNPRRGWRPLLDPTARSQELMERSLTSLQDVFSWIESGGVPGDLQGSQRDALEEVDEFLRGQDFEGPFEAFLRATPLEAPPTKPPEELAGLPVPPMFNGWSGRSLMAFAEARGEMERLDREWIRFGAGEEIPDLPANLRMFTLVPYSTFTRHLEQLRSNPANRGDLRRWSRTATLSYQVMTRAALLSLRNEPLRRPWMLRCLWFMVARESLPLPMSFAGRSRKGFLRWLPRDAAEWYLFGLLEYRVARLQKRLFGKIDLVERGLPALARAWELATGDPDEALIRGLVARSQFLQRASMRRFHEALAGYWKHRKLLLTVTSGGALRLDLERILGIWEGRGHPPSAVHMRLFWESLKVVLSSGGKKEVALGDRFQVACQKWKKEDPAFRFQATEEGYTPAPSKSPSLGAR